MTIIEAERNEDDALLAAEDEAIWKAEHPTEDPATPVGDDLAELLAIAEDIQHG